MKLSSVPPIVEDENCQDVLQLKKNNLKVKRGKRSLTAERDRSSPLSVKVLRRCQTQNVVQTVANSRVTLQVVKNLKTTK